MEESPERIEELGEWIPEREKLTPGEPERIPLNLVFPCPAAFVRKTDEDTEKYGRMLRNVKVNNNRSLGEWQPVTKVLVNCGKGNNGRSSFSSQDSGKTEATENVERKQTSSK